MRTRASFGLMLIGCGKEPITVGAQFLKYVTADLLEPIGEILSFLDSSTMRLQGYMAKEGPFRRSSVCSSGTLFSKI